MSTARKNHKDPKDAESNHFRIKLCDLCLFAIFALIQALYDVRTLNAPINQSPQVRRLVIEFLAWLAARPRTYAQTMEAWRSSCPRNSIFEDALIEGLIQIDRVEKQPTDEAAITLTARGRDALGNELEPQNHAD
jgi:hypothetical protein